MTSLLIQGPSLYTESEIIENASLSIHDDSIDAFFACHDNYSNSFSFPSSYAIVPGYIDLHVHGVAGVDVMDATPTALNTMSQMLAREGTTSFLATTMSMPIPDIYSAIKNIASYLQAPHENGAEILGIHLEGPFIAPDKMGAHQKKYLLDLNIPLIREWQTVANGAIKLLTFAPELNNSDEFIDCLRTLNIIPAIGHSNATFQQTENAIKRGCKHITHLFNAMSGLHHRHPGVALSALQNDILCELIADGHHVSWDMLNFIMQKKGFHELCLVTDSMRAKCMPDGEYRLGEQKVYLKNSSAKLEDGTLAGSVLSMQHAVKNLIEQKICTLQESIFLSSINPAKQLGLFNTIGSIAIGKRADIVILNEQYDVVMTIRGGKILYNVY